MSILSGGTSGTLACGSGQPPPLAYSSLRASLALRPDSGMIFVARLELAFLRGGAWCLAKSSGEPTEIAVGVAHQRLQLALDVVDGAAQLVLLLDHPLRRLRCS